jgi:hypothetical protein
MNAPDIAAVTLLKGSHKTRKAGVCAMELVAWMAGEKHSDSPACVSPVLSSFLRRWNDDLDDDGRQRLKPYLPRVIGTAADGFDADRGWMLTDWMVRCHLPAWLELSGINEPAAKLRSLPELRSIDGLNAAVPAITEARKISGAASGAAWGAAWGAASGAAWGAAWGAARDAAWGAAWGAARDAARDAATKKLEPTKISLQDSAFALLDRLIDPAGTRCEATGSEPA